MCSPNSSKEIIGGEIMKSKLTTPPWSECMAFKHSLYKLFVTCTLMLFDYICLGAVGKRLTADTSM